MIRAGQVVLVELEVDVKDEEEEDGDGEPIKKSGPDDQVPKTIEYARGVFHYGEGENREKAIGERGLSPGNFISFVCVASPIQVAYRSVKDQIRSQHLVISNDSFEQITVDVTQKNSKFHLESSLDPGASINFIGRNPGRRLEVFTKTTTFEDTYSVTVKKDNHTYPVSELSLGQELRFGGMEV